MAYPTTLPGTTPRTWMLLTFLLITASSPCVGSRQAASPPLPGEVYFKAPEFTSPAISPDGKNVAFIAQNNGRACLFRLELKTGQVSGLFSAGEGDVETFWWTGSNRVLLAGRGESGR